MFTISKEIQDIESTNTPGDSNKNAGIFFYPKEHPTTGGAVVGRVSRKQVENIFWNLEPSSPDEFTV